jgi:hypothetical protein
VKIQVNHRPKVLLLALLLALWQVRGPAFSAGGQAFEERAAGARGQTNELSPGLCLGAAVIAVGGTVVYCLIKACKKFFPKTNAPPATNGWHDPLYIYIERSTNMKDWEVIGRAMGDLDDFEYVDIFPPSPAFYRATTNEPSL